MLDRQGEVAGVYTALFSRHRKVWKLRELTVFEAGDTVEPAAHYCRKPGDVMEHRLSSTEAWRSTAEERVATARTRLAEARAALAEARADATAESHDSRLVLEVNEARRDVAQWTKQVEQREKNLADAAEAFADARSDADENKRLTGAARNALAFRIADQETAAAN